LILFLEACFSFLFGDVFSRLGDAAHFDFVGVTKHRVTAYTCLQGWS
jgi:hypothetical protein